MKSSSFLLTLSKICWTIILYAFSNLALSQGSLAGHWILYDGNAAGVGPSSGSMAWWRADADIVRERTCWIDNHYNFGDDGSFKNILGDETWLETWQGAAAAGCGAPVAPHDGSVAATFVYDEAAGTLTITGVGSYLGIPKATNGAEISSPSSAPASITYNVLYLAADGKTMTVSVEAGAGVWWTFNLVKVPVQVVAGILSLDHLYAGETTNLSVTYQATENMGTTGLGLRLHYDSSALEMGDYTFRLRESAQPFQIKEDTSDFDSDPKTDKYFLTSWADTSGDGWPYSVAQPAVLYTVPLTALNGFNGSTLEFTASSTAAGFALEASAITIAIDNIPPIISMIGADVRSARGLSYIDKGATAMDNVDGDVSANIVTTSNVNINSVGTYLVKYNVSDGNGNEATEVIRYVTIINSDTDGDGILDSSDNCVNQANSDQLDTDEDSLGNACDPDDDNDGVSDSDDTFPLDATETEDTDSDGIGNNTDEDDDGDGVSDIDEETAGSNPLVIDTDNDGILDGEDIWPTDSSKSISGRLFDIDGNGDIDALTDGLLILRYIFSLQGDMLINGVVADDATRKTAEEIEAHLETLMPAL